MGEIRHLTRRFFAALTNRGPRESDRVWVESVLSPREYALWACQYPPDRRHSALIARQVERRLAGHPEFGEDTRWVLASALLHDVGKIEAGLGAWSRVFATVVGRVWGSERVRQWAHDDGFRGRVSSYLRHPEIGAELLRDAQSDPRTVAWAAEHHQRPDKWTVPVELAQMLHEFDND
ncbi:MAG: HD domain-containing protein [Acidimicrobiaceae bacterium]|nr:HD domain-containing protein [Acidimicrobiaceae bacterium]MDE0605835.1 HD domain-containing protein [Acidimicrobiaceae bacterium]